MTAAASAAGTPRVAVVAAGAGARGAYEAGVLSVLLPALAKAGCRPRTFVGTSAGAINAVALAASAHLTPEGAADQLVQLWSDISARDIFRPVWRTAPVTALNYLATVSRLGPRPLSGLLDTSPLGQTAQDRIDWEQLHDNVGEGHLDALAIVATSARRGRSVVFVEQGSDFETPATDTGRAVDYVAARIDATHVLASAAIPVAFPTVRVENPDSAAGWYTDGGVRMNAPLKPALALGANHLVVVATHPATYPPAPDSVEAAPPDLDDITVQVLDAALVDRMVEDIHTLGKLNSLVASGGQRSNGRKLEVVPYLFFGPQSRSELGRLAKDIYQDQYAGPASAWRLLRSPEYPALRHLISGPDPWSGDLLSYVYFDPAFLSASLALGQRQAKAALPADGEPLPWAVDAP